MTLREGCVQLPSRRAGDSGCGLALAKPLGLALDEFLLYAEPPALRTLLAHLKFATG
jgi:hypothetical protein